MVRNIDFSYFSNKYALYRKINGLLIYMSESCAALARHHSTLLRDIEQ